MRSASRHSGVLAFAGTNEAGMMPPLFVVDFTALLVVGVNPATVVSVVGAIAQGLAKPQQSRQGRRIVSSAATVAVATQAAGWAYVALAGTADFLVWPAKGLAIAAAVFAYCFVRSAADGIVVPLLTRHPINRSSLKAFADNCPGYLIGASVAAGLAELIAHRAWDLLAVVVLPLFFAYRAYSS